MKYYLYIFEDVADRACEGVEFVPVAGDWVGGVAWK